MTDAQAMAGLAILGAFSLVLLLLAVVLYVLFAVGLTTLAKSRDLPNPWIAWIPIAQIYTLGEVIGPVRLGSFNITQPGLYLLLAIIGLWILSALPVIGLIFLLANSVVFIGTMYLLYSRYTTDSTPILFTILSVLLPVLVPIFIFVIRNNQYSAPAIEAA